MFSWLPYNSNSFNTTDPKYFDKNGVCSLNLAGVAPERIKLVTQVHSDYTGLYVKLDGADYWLTNLASGETVEATLALGALHIKINTPKPTQTEIQIKVV
jgi:hypothetical protein